MPNQLPRPQLSSEFDYEPSAKLPEQRLAAAIIQRAVLDFLQPHTEIRWRREAEAWLFLHDIDDYPSSFGWCCSACYLQPEAVRNAIKAFSGDPSVFQRFDRAASRIQIAYCLNHK